MPRLSMTRETNDFDWQLQPMIYIHSSVGYDTFIPKAKQSSAFFANNWDIGGCIRYHSTIGTSSNLWFSL